VAIVKWPPPNRRIELNPKLWAPLAEASARVKALRGSIDLTERDLRRDFRHGQLQAAYRAIVYQLDAKPGEFQSRVKDYEASGLFPRVFWDQHGVRVNGDGTAGLRGIEGEQTGWRWNAQFVFIFVRRAELDKRYSREVTPVEDEVLLPARRKPGPKIKKGWKLFAAHAAYVFKEKHGRLPTGPELAQLCEDKLGYQPDVSDIAKLLRFLLDE
jgi:hypothetical protein